jgi:hypothetical protein
VNTFRYGTTLRNPGTLAGLTSGARCVLKPGDPAGAHCPLRADVFPIRAATVEFRPGDPARGRRSRDAAALTSTRYYSRVYELLLWDDRGLIGTGADSKVTSLDLPLFRQLE